MTELILPSDLRPVIVEDHPNIRMLMRVSLGKYGIVPSEFGDSRTALDHIKAIKDFNPRRDLIATDYDVPPLSGPEFASGVRDIYPESRIIVISGRMPEDIESAFPGLFNRILKKPYSPQQFIRMLSELAV